MATCSSSIFFDVSDVYHPLRSSGLSQFCCQLRWHCSHSSRVHKSIAELAEASEEQRELGIYYDIKSDFFF